MRAPRRQDSSLAKLYARQVYGMAYALQSDRTMEISLTYFLQLTVNGIVLGLLYLFTATSRLVDASLGLEGFELGDIRITWIRCLAALAAFAAFVALG